MPTAPKVLRMRKAKRVERRPNSGARLYDRRWRKATQVWLAEQFSKGKVLCALCGKPLDGSRSDIQVDHRVPPSRVGIVGTEAYETAFRDPANWQASHPACNVRKGNRASGYMVRVITGPPGSGKTTWVQEHSRTGDMCYDLDVIGGAIGGFSEYRTRPADMASLLLAWRDVLVQRINQQRIDRDTWIIVTDRKQAQDVADSCGGCVVDVVEARNG